MTVQKAEQMYKQFHLKEPDRIVRLNHEIPRYVYPVGFCPQVSYNSNKWNQHNEWKRYIHWWANPTLVCVEKNILKDINLDVGFHSDQEFDLGPGRGEVTFLGYAIDFAVTEDDRSKESENDDQAKLRDSYEFVFCDNPHESRDYVVSSPNGRVVYVVAEGGEQIYAFINPYCRVTRHGIEG